MRLSLLQPRITTGDVEQNVETIQRLIDAAEGDLLVLPEYALTGAVLADNGTDPRHWARLSEQAAERLRIPAGKMLLANALIERGGALLNCCMLLPAGEQQQCKRHLSRVEQAAGLVPGGDQQVFDCFDRRFRVLICTDLGHVQPGDLSDVDFLLWIFHFTRANTTRAMSAVRRLSEENAIRVFVSSLVSDANIGLSAYVDGQVQLVLPLREGILEVIVT